MAYDEVLPTRIRYLLKDRDSVSEKNMKMFTINIWR